MSRWATCMAATFWAVVAPCLGWAIVDALIQARRRWAACH